MLVLLDFRCLRSIYNALYGLIHFFSKFLRSLHIKKKAAEL